MEQKPEGQQGVGVIYWGPFMAWGFMLGRRMDHHQWGYVAPYVKDYDDFQSVGNDAIAVISMTMETLGIYTRPRPACASQLLSSGNIGRNALGALQLA
jgi:hypothetical protein